LTGRETVLDLAGVTPITTDGLSLSSVLAGGKLRRSGILLEHKGNPTTKDTVPSYCGSGPTDTCSPATPTTEPVFRKKRSTTRTRMPSS